MYDPNFVFPDILTLLRKRAALHPEAIALEDVTSRDLVTYADLLRRVERMGRSLRATGGRRIGLVLPNGAQLSETLLAAACAGTALPFNPALTALEFETYFRDTRIDLVIARQDVSPMVVRLASQMGLRVLSPVALLHMVVPDVPFDPPAAQDIAMVLLTSGSTGRPKRAPLSHQNVCTSARDVARSLRLGRDDRCLSMWELFHVGGLVDLLLAPLHSGGTVIATPGFESQRFFDLLPVVRPTWFQGVPTTLGDILRQQARHGASLLGTPLRLVRSVAAPLSPNQMTALETAFGVPVLQTFGMTEAGPLITSLGLEAETRVLGSVGQSCGCDIRVVLPDGGDATPGAEGELMVRGPNVFGGYEDDQDANAAAFHGEWFKTGDLGRFDALGNLFLTGRSKDLVNRGGEKVNLREVDDALAAHPWVSEAASFAVPHPTLGEDIAAAVVLKPGVVWNASEVTNSLRASLAQFKLPASFFVVDALPRNAVGKLDRKVLAQQSKRETNPGSQSTESELEAQIAKIWAKELGLAAVSGEASFSALGGDSLAALRVLLELEKVFGLLPPEIAGNRLETVRKLAQQLTSILTLEPKPGQDCAAQDCTAFTEAHRKALLAVIAAPPVPSLRPGSGLKLANATGSRPPIIWFFNAPASEMPPFAQGLSARQPLYGGFSCAHAFDWHDPAMDGLAHAYTAELLREFPEGPFRLGGNCQGGRLAWLITKKLEAAGRTVEALAVLEYSEPDLGRFSGRLLMMFGMHSSNQHYRQIRWGEHDWHSQFVRPPVAVWIPGMHGGFFAPHTVGMLTDTVRSFFENISLSAFGIETQEGREIWSIHQDPDHFDSYVRQYCYVHGLVRPAPLK